MRNSFEEMKKFIAEQDDILVETGNKQHDRTVSKIIVGGPRPQPSTTPKFSQRGSGDDEGDDAPAKRQNVFRRALKGLGGRNQHDLVRIEEMLAHLLGEVESLKNGQEGRPSIGDTRAASLDSYHNMRATDPTAYEPQAQAGLPSGGNSGYFSNPSSRGPSAMRSMGDRQGSQNRVSTVLEADEELDEHEQQLLDNQSEDDENLLTPTREHPRAGSVPLATPPQAQLAAAAAKSTENTPKTSTDKSRKHKSNSSSIFPKVSRWSKTTASSIGENFRYSAAKKERPYSEASRSGDLQNYDHNDHNDHYDPQGDDRLRSAGSLANEHEEQQPLSENRPPSPLIPSQISASDDPKYQAHRNSLNLQHPQPRQGPTQRYQHHLESQAQKYGSRSPISPTSDTFGSDPALSRFMPGNRYSTGGGHLSPISDDGYSETSSAAAEATAAPPRPPKIKDDGPLIPASVTGTAPARPPKLGKADNKPNFASPLSRETLRSEESDERRYSGASAADEVSFLPRSPTTLHFPPS